MVIVAVTVQYVNRELHLDALSKQRLFNGEFPLNGSCLEQSSLGKKALPFKGLIQKQSSHPQALLVFKPPVSWPVGSCQAKTLLCFLPRQRLQHFGAQRVSETPCDAAYSYSYSQALFKQALYVSNITTEHSLFGWPRFLVLNRPSLSLTFWQQ